jgi:toxin YoeB
VEIEFTKNADLDIEFWKKSGQKSIQKKISNLLKDMKKNPYTGLGKPELLKYNLSGSWSREINKKNRLLYDVDETENKIIVHSLCGHYFDK